MFKNTDHPFSAGPTLEGLKRFQRTTVDYIFKRFYLDSDATSRFLVADEVGLGKTLVAKGVVAKAIEHLREKLGQDHRIDIIYICSNSSIARQNIDRLNVMGSKGFDLASRITLLPTQLNDMERSPNKINFVSFTPGTSFDQKSSTGIVNERIILYKMLQAPWNLKGVTALNLLQGNVQNTDNYRRLAEQDVNINRDIATRFSDMVCDNKNAALRDEFEKLSTQFQRSRITTRPQEQREARNRIIGKLREILAEACIDSLEPDIVILDEFQRFKHLLSDEDDCSILARRLFEHVDKKSGTCAKTLLLSATPYKMYTLREEADAEDHYSDFMLTYRFLERDKARQNEFEELLRQYRDILLSPKLLGSAQANEVRDRIETLLRKVMVRTERLAATNDRNGMLKEVGVNDRVSFNTSQVRSYMALDKIAVQLEMPSIVEYWKSSPYLLNFMDDYVFKQSFNEAVKQSPFRTKVLKETNDCMSSMLLSEDDIRSYNEIDPCNANMGKLISDSLDSGAWKTLWIPPSLPYYRLGEPFHTLWEKNYSKRLVFSTWKVVPKAISVMLSYDAERRMNQLMNKEIQNSSEARKKRSPLLRFAITQGHQTGMPLFTLIYPCLTMAKQCDPLIIYSALATGDDKLPNLEDVLKQVKEQLVKLCEKLKPIENVAESKDESWYWVAPLILDDINSSRNDKLSEQDLSEMWPNLEENNEDEQTQTDDDQAEHTNFDKHVERVKLLINDYRQGNLKLGKMPDDLYDVLSFMAIAGPATCAYRAFSRNSDKDQGAPTKVLWTSAAKVGYSFIGMFNSPDIIEMIRGFDGREPYWRRVLEYCANGCIQSTIDEYVHILMDQKNKNDPNAISSVTTKLCDAMSLRTASLSVDNIDPITLQKKSRLESYGRVHYAVRFGDEKGDDGDVVTRSDQVKNSFNSPFWPFVLATTSIGQEGLDFHQYCHAVVHWNLPSNPIDLEQREGRIHRYKNHAVRKNIAKHYGPLIRKNQFGDIWGEMFRQAASEYGEKHDDIVPYWVFQIEGGACIERYIPLLPLSREIDRSILLKRSLAAYRMVFGQARQEDLVEYLMSSFKPEEIDAIGKQMQIDLSPPK